MPYVITIDPADGSGATLFYAGPGKSLSANVEDAYRYPDYPTGDLTILQARGFAADYEVVT